MPQPILDPPEEEAVAAVMAMSFAEPMTAETTEIPEETVTDDLPSNLAANPDDAINPWSEFTSDPDQHFDVYDGFASSSDLDRFTTNQTHTVTETDANGGLIVTVYNSDGMMLSLTDPVGNTTSWTYNQSGQILTDTNQLGHTRYYEYDESGNLTRYTNRNGELITYDYDTNGNTLKETWHENGIAVRATRYTYNDADQLLTVDDLDTDYRYIYNANDQVATELITPKGEATTRLDYTYTNAGMVATLSVTIDGVPDFTNEYSYDSANRLRKLIQHGVENGNPVTPKKAEFHYNALGLCTSIDRYEGVNGNWELVVTSDYNYTTTPTTPITPTDFNQWGAFITLDSLSHVDANGNTLAAHDWTYDDAGLVESYTNTDGEAQYQYDPEGQLVSADYDYQEDESYAYDANGNRVEHTIGENNQILCDGTYWYEYDEEGSRTEKYQWTDTNADEIIDADEKFDVTSYRWDHRGRLTKITTLPDGQQSSQIAKYQYDYLNRRVDKKIESYDSDGKKVKTSEKYTYVDDDIVLQTNKKGELTNRYLHGQITDQCLADERLFDDNGDEAINALYPLFDNQNTIRDIVDYDPTTGETSNVNHITYGAFGSIVAETDPNFGMIYGYTNRETDRESDLHYHRERYTIPSLGTFISPDPIGFAGGDVNLYRYVGNSPTNGTDPTGLESPELKRRLESTWSMRHITNGKHEDQRNPWNVINPASDGCFAWLTFYAVIGTFEMTPIAVSGSCDEARTKLREHAENADSTFEKVVLNTGAIATYPGEFSINVSLDLIGVGEIQSAREIATGRSSIDGRKLNLQERHGAALFMFLPGGTGVPNAKPQRSVYNSMADGHVHFPANHPLPPDTGFGTPNRSYPFPKKDVQEATLGNASSSNYRKTFFEEHPHLEGHVFVHHGVEQQVSDLFPGKFAKDEIHSLENLRGIPKALNNDLHLSKIRKEWNTFYVANPNATRQKILDEATRIDRLFGHLFNPPL